jgi:hypothetical protein
MADVTYKVEVELSTKGNLAQKLGGFHSQAGSLDAAFAKVGGAVSSMGSALDGAVDRAASLAGTLATLGGVAVGAALAYGVANLNNELERTQIALAAIFRANELSTSIEAGLGLAGETMTQMRRDAAALPGEFRDLVGIFKTVSVPGFQAGASIDELRKLSATAMAVSAVMGLPMEQTARELAMLLEGRAGAHNVLGMRLGGLGGDKAEKFNKMSAPEHMTEVTRLLDKFAPALGAYAKSYDGIVSTLKDSGKKLLGDFTQPLFERVKATAQRANDWFDRWGDTASRIASVWGEKLGIESDAGVEKIRIWYPAIATFTSNLATGIASAFDRIHPILLKMEEVGYKFLSDPKSIGKIAGMLEMVAAAKIGIPILSGAMGAAGAASKFAAPMAEAAGAAGAAGPIGFAVVVGVLETLAVAAVAAGGAISALLDPLSMMHETAVGYWRDIMQSVNELEPNTKGLGSELKLTAEIIGTQMLGVLAAASGALSSFVGYIQSVADTASYLANFGKPQLNREDQFVAPSAREVELLSTFPMAIAKGIVAHTTKPKTGGGGGGGGTHIAKVEITVTSNTDPSRIARLVYADLANLARHRTTSPDVRNFSASRP